jgi:hypothetical protein
MSPTRVTRRTEFVMASLETGSEGASRQGRAERGRACHN